MQFDREERKGKCVHMCLSVSVCVEWKSDVTGVFTKALWMNAQWLPPRKPF